MTRVPESSEDEPVTVRFTYRGGDYRLELSPAAARRFASAERAFDSRPERGRRRVGLPHRARAVH